MASIKFKKAYLGLHSSLSSQDEQVTSTHKIDDYFDGELTSEEAEIKMQKTVLNDIIKSKKIDLIIGSDLSNQLGITNQTMSKFNLSYLGVYNACSSFVESLIIGSSLLDGSNLKNIGVLTSSNNLEAERTFRYPIEYGSPRKITQTFTATGAVACVLSKEQTKIKIESATIGKVIDYDITDANNMGAIMAPGAVNTLLSHLKEMNRNINYYDVVLTGDLGKLGSDLFKELLSFNDIRIKNYIDAGSILITDTELTDQGGSGPACLPLILFEKILKIKKYKKILIIGTGSMHNTTMVNQSKSIPALSHAVSLEVL